MNKRSIFVLLALLAVLPFAGSLADEEGVGKGTTKRNKIDSMAQETLDRLFAENGRAQELYAKSAGYAVFSNVKVSVGITGGGGKGVAVSNAARLVCAPDEGRRDERESALHRMLHRIPVLVPE